MAVAGVAGVLASIGGAGVAGAAGPDVPAVPNGDFEADAVGSTTVSGWTVVDGLVDLGVTSLGGCVSRDTSTYTALRDHAATAFPVRMRDVPVGSDDRLLHPGTGDDVWMDAAGQPTTAGAPGARQLYFGLQAGGSDGFRDFFIVEGGTPYWRTNWGQATGNTDLSPGFGTGIAPWYSAVPDPVLRADDVSAAHQAWFWRDTPWFGAAIADGTPAPGSWYTVDPLPRSRALQLDTFALTWEAGVVVHGPAAVSDPFTVGSDRTVMLDWVAPSSIGEFMDSSVTDHHVLAYVLDVDSCRQYELLDSTGGTTEWQTAGLALPAGGTYRVVVVAGAYDHRWSEAASSLLFVDDVRVLPTITGAGVVLEPLFGQGEPAAGAPVQLTGAGLLPNSPWTAELRSTPVTLASGVTDASGSFRVLTDLPSSVEPGRHRILVSATAPDGTPRTDTAWITVMADGTVGYLSLAAEEGSGTPTPPSVPADQDGDDDAAPAPVAGRAPAEGAEDDGAGDGPEELASTGFDAALPLTVGCALLLAGAAVLVRLRPGRRQS